MWMPDANDNCLPPSVCPLALETRSPAEPGAHQSSMRSFSLLSTGCDKLLPFPAPVTVAKTISSSTVLLPGYPSTATGNETRTAGLLEPGLAAEVITDTCPLQSRRQLCPSTGVAAQLCLASSDFLSLRHNCDCHYCYR